MKQAKKINKLEFLNLRFNKNLTEYPNYFHNYNIQLFSAYESKNILPFSGCLSDQPNKVIEVFNVLRALVNEKNEKDKKK